MKILFVCSGNKGRVNPLIQNQARSIEQMGATVDYYLINGKGVYGYIKNIRPLKTVLNGTKYDVVHAHYSLSAFVASLAGAKPLIVSLMGSDVKAKRWYKNMIKIFNRLFGWKKIIVKSKDMFYSLGIIDAAVIPNGVDIERFKPLDQKECQRQLNWDSSKKHILFPSNPIRPEKNYKLAKEAVDMLSVNLSVELHPLINIPNEETPIWYNAADVVLMTSLWEGSPNAIKEAMACNRPIVAANVGDIKERVRDVTGCFVYNNTDGVVSCYKVLLIALQLQSTDGKEKLLQDKLDSISIANLLKDLYIN